MISARALCMATAIAAGPSAALEPVAGPGNYAGVCDGLALLWRQADVLVAATASARPHLAEYDAFLHALYALGFSPETRATVNADDLDPVLGAAEIVALAGGTPADPALVTALHNQMIAFGGKYRCRVKQ